MNGFDLSSNVNTLKKLFNVVQNISYEDDFDTEKMNTIGTILSLMLKDTKNWDENTKITSSYIGDTFISKVNRILEEDIKTNSSSFDEIFSCLFRYYLEMDLSSPRLDDAMYISNIKEFAINNLEKFTLRAPGQILYGLNSLPIDVLKKLISSKEIKNINDYIDTIKDSKKQTEIIISKYTDEMEKYKLEAEKKQKDWKDYISTKQDEITEIKKSLENYGEAFNFVGLYEGFKNLSNEKKIEKKWSFWTVITLGLCVLIPLAFEFYQFSVLAPQFKNPYDIISLIPVFSIVFILVYYFRIALQNHSSVKAQLSQIELRKTLCQFIQSYGDYAAKAKADDKESLSKFENIIFSNIITDENNIPATFDGFHQITKLIGDFKKGS